jgi:ABC-type multidrug transport system fused ATPase/permease subunit
MNGFWFAISFGLFRTMQQAQSKNKSKSESPYSLSAILDRSIGILISIVSQFLFGIISIYGIEIEMFIIVVLLFTIWTCINTIIEPLIRIDSEEGQSPEDCDKTNDYRWRVGIIRNRESKKIIGSINGFIYMLVLFLIFTFFASIATTVWKRSNLNLLENIVGLFCLLIGTFSLFHTILYWKE